MIVKDRSATEADVYHTCKRVPLSRAFSPVPAMTQSKR